MSFARSSFVLLMLKLHQISKKYGQQHAVRALSFSISKGEVVGFLGPNGAGKSTTMRIISGCSTPTAGQVYINSTLATPHTNDHKHQIGYLPEHPPLYPEMMVEEYLLFCCAIKNVSNPSKATQRVLHTCDLRTHAHRQIHTLSKGYKQRVGLAQALIHNPKLLILDEPTSGLDPAQRMEFRNLIKQLSNGARTVLLSTHILSEVEAICDRVIVIAHGSIVAQDTILNLKSMEQRVRVRTEKDNTKLFAQLEQHRHITRLFSITPHELEVEYDRDIRSEIAAIAVPFCLVELRQATTLEDIYLRLITKTS